MSMNILLPFADGVVAVSNGAADDLARFARIDRRKITTIYNPVIGSQTAVRPIAKTPLRWWEGGHVRILAVGTFAPIKDFPTLLRAFASLRKLKDARLLILGEGNCRQQLNEIAIGLGISGYVEMPGFISNTAVYYERCDLFVASSISEALPTVLIEALNAGAPIISTDCPSGPREILENGKYGILTPVGDAEALTDAMLKSLNSSHDRDALKSRAQDFTIANATDQYLDLLLPDWRAHSPERTA